MRSLQEAIQCLAYEVQRVGENEAHEREKRELCLELQTLHATKPLPSGEPGQGAAED